MEKHLQSDVREYIENFYELVLGDPHTLVSFTSSKSTRISQWKSKTHPAVVQERGRLIIVKYTLRALHRKEVLGERPELYSSWEKRFPPTLVSSRLPIHLR